MSWSQMIKYLNFSKKWQLAVYGSYTAVSSQFLIASPNSNCHANSKCCNSFVRLSNNPPPLLFSELNDVDKDIDGTKKSYL